MNKELVIPEGLTYTPRYVKQESDLGHGDVVSHENYNEKLNLNTTQGDYNTGVLELLLSNSDPTKVHHVPYLDKLIKDNVDRIDAELGEVNDRIDDAFTEISNTNNDLSELSKKVTNIINGTTAIGKAEYANKITGIDTAPKHHYYGTSYSGAIGFHEMPDSIYAKPIAEDDVSIDGIYYIPKENSVAESMLTEEVREKLNRQAITDYNELTGKPQINSVELTGNKTLEELGIQPKGDYLTSIPDEYTTTEEVDALLDNYKVTDIDPVYAKITALNAVDQKVEENKTYAEGRYARVCINTFDGTPKKGDILVTL